MAGTFMHYFLMVWLAALAALVGYRLLTGKINTRGLLSDSETRTMSPERIQLLITTVVSVAAFSQDALAHQKFSDPSALMLSGVAGSQALYVAGKLVRRLVANGKAST
jgi:hypothetical protein